FGLARVYLAQGARDGAIEVLDSVPPSSTHYTAAQIGTIRVKTRIPAGVGTAISEHDLVDAGVRLRRLTLDAERFERLSAEVLAAAHERVRAVGSNPADSSARVLDHPLTDRELRFALEHRYRVLARRA